MLTMYEFTWVHSNRMMPLCAVADEVLQNVALNKSSFQMSTYNSSYSADNGNDGNSLTCARSRTTSYYPWWAVDLGSETLVYQVKFTNTRSSGTLCSLCLVACCHFDDTLALFSSAITIQNKPIIVGPRHLTAAIWPRDIWPPDSWPCDIWHPVHFTARQLTAKPCKYILFYFI